MRLWSNAEDMNTMPISIKLAAMLTLALFLTVG